MHPSRAILLRRRASALEAVAAVDRELADLEERGEDTTPAVFSQVDSPLGRSRHLRACRREGLPHERVGRLVFVRRADFDVWAETKRAASKDRRKPAPVFDLRAAMGLEAVAVAPVGRRASR